MYSDEHTYWLLVTERFDYVTRDWVCVGVRYRQTGEWLDPHYALGGRVNLVPAQRRFARTRWEVEVSTDKVQVTVGPLQSMDSAPAEVVRHVARRAYRQQAEWMRAAG